jgi:hypothetical protein
MVDGTDFGKWQPMATAPKDGSRVLVVVRATEQGPSEVDVARWTKPEPAADACWVATDSDYECVIAYAESELAFWMPLPSMLPPQVRDAYRASIPPEADEMSGSGI